MGAGLAVGLADHLPHLESAASDQERRQRRPVVAAPGSADARRAAHLARDDQHDLVRQATRFHVRQERGDGVIDLIAQPVHAGEIHGAIVVRVHVPAGVHDGDEAAAMLDQSAGEQHLFAEQVRRAAHVAPAMYVGEAEKFAGVIGGDQARILARQIERLADAAQQEIVGLLIVAAADSKPRVRSAWRRKLSS